MTKNESVLAQKTDSVISARKRIFFLNIGFYVLLGITGVVLTITGTPVYGEGASAKLSILFTGLLFVPVLNHLVSNKSHSE